jgi:dihydrodipicolinate synthase/N-acetylneuraminate lyase
MTDAQLRGLREGALFALGVGALSALIIMVFFPGEEQTTEKFKVVDQYAGCNVVRYANPKRATYDYFLHCNK